MDGGQGGRKEEVKEERRRVKEEVKEKGNGSGHESTSVCVQVE